MKANHLKPFGVVIFSLLAIASCSSNTSTESKNSNLEGSYELVKVDSLMVPVLELLQITDYNPKTNRFLAYGTQSKACMEIDAEGNVLSSVDLTGEGPGHFGEGMTELGYLGDDIIINGPNAYFTFDKNWNYKERIVYISGGAFYPLGFISGAPETFVKNGVAKIIKPIDHTYFGSRVLPNDYFSKAFLTEYISSQTQESETIISYPEGSIYLSNTIFYPSPNAKISYNTSASRLYITFPLIPKLFVYDVDKNFDLEKTLGLDLKGFKEPRGISFEDQNKRGPDNYRLSSVYDYLNSSIYEISSEGDITIVTYDTGIEGNEHVNTFKEISSIAKSESKVMTAFFLVDKKVLEMEERFLKSVRISETKFLAHYINKEEELDYNKFYIYELKKVK
tara:strand:- start:283443 stop:284621 length:1179 start_codon:yes stop_codon:yes gene_type:complete